jgi:RNA polymerase sigma-70 factor (ECF subfamily)
MEPDASDVNAAELSERFFRRVALFAARRLGDRSSGEDVAQETLHRVLSALREGRVESLDSLPGFVFQTANHLCMQQARKRGREARALERLQRTDPVYPPSSDEVLISAERVEQLHGALDQLREADREILREAYENWRGTEEIASRLGLSPEAVRVRKHRALKRLGDLLRQNDACNSPRGSGTRE